MEATEKTATEKTTHGFKKAEVILNKQPLLKIIYYYFNISNKEPANLNYNAHLKSDLEIELIEIY